MVAADGQFVARFFPCRLLAFLALAEPSSATEESRALREVVTEVLTNHCAWPRNGKKYAS